MSLPNYLAKIKSSGMYRFTFDKSQIPAAAAETMRLVIGYSEKGPFNNPVYIDNRQDFIELFGNINKRLEKKGVFFHRMALQALSAGPIIALNLKPFTSLNDEGTGTAEQVNYIAIDPCDVTKSPMTAGLVDVKTLFDTHRFWKLDADQLPKKLNSTKYINIAATDSVDTSCSIFVRQCNKTDVKGYDVSVRDWYRNLGEDVPEYLAAYIDNSVADFFAEVYVFRGEFTDSLTTNDGPLSKYFDDTNTSNLKLNYTEFGREVDVLGALSSDPNSNFVGLYRGCLLPYFTDQFGQYVALDIVFNADKDVHKMIMKLDDSIIDDMLTPDDEDSHVKLLHWGYDNAANQFADYYLCPTYIEGYTYGTIHRNSSPMDIYEKTIGMLNDKGIFEALTNHVDSEYHYIVDTYAAIPSVDISASKLTIANLAKTKDNCLAIMNAPAMSELQSLPGFDECYKTGKFNSIGFTLPTDAGGASYCAYYTPVVFGSGLVKTTVPSAALVSNLFMEKWNSRQPYYIVAGPNYGVIDAENLVGPDYNYSRTDLDVLEPMGINAIVYVPRKGTYINSNQTAKQTPVSALSKVHVRELVIYLQNEIEAMMQSYQWELNTQVLRDNIKAKADAILERIKNNGGVYDYLNVCDASNNTPDVIDNEMVILDTSIEPARGAGKMVQRLTIHRTGGISSLTK